jgi:hypothetical protein
MMRGLGAASTRVTTQQPRTLARRLTTAVKLEQGARASRRASADGVTSSGQANARAATRAAVTGTAVTVVWVALFRLMLTILTGAAGAAVACDGEGGGGSERRADTAAGADTCVGMQDRDRHKLHKSQAPATAALWVAGTQAGAVAQRRAVSQTTHSAASHHPHPWGRRRVALLRVSDVAGVHEHQLLCSQRDGVAGDVVAEPVARDVHRSLVALHALGLVAADALGGAGVRTAALWLVRQAAGRGAGAAAARV